MWAEVIADGRRIYRALRPGPEAEHRRRARLAVAGGSPAQNRALGRAMAAERGWTGAEFAALDYLWGRKESGWRSNAHNPSSGACHIPQALPCSKIPGGLSATARTAIAWGLDYIAGRYGRPSAALAHSHSRGWY